MVSWCFKANLYSPAGRRWIGVGPLALSFHRGKKTGLCMANIWTDEVQAPLSSEYRRWDIGSWVGWCVVVEDDMERAALAA